ncbi:MarR family winged helix-turn-helix transcriptional regulator [Streptomyces sp. NPDC101237]|uniref:MarR family winged helix-turn-helix transcriptional regulator n=1 Tax=Streptomyces sp. NPDC101237 TaxID=3366139 RepID=UPI0038292E12
MADDDTEIRGLVRELVTLSRRFRGNAERLHPDLSFVDYSLLSEMDARDGARATDLVGLYGLNKSTISRQVTALQRAGLVVREADPQDHRARLLRPSDLGRELLARADALMYREVDARTEGWDAGEVRALGGLLARYNAGASAVAADAPDS